MGYACLVAIMSVGPGYHKTSEARLTGMAAETGHAAPVVTSAGALVDGLKDLSAKRISIVTPYMRPLTDLVVNYIEDQGIEVIDSIALEIPDNLQVGRRDPMLLLDDVEALDVEGADAVVISACVQMPSLAAIDRRRTSWVCRLRRPQPCWKPLSLSRSCLGPARCSVLAGICVS